LNPSVLASIVAILGLALVAVLFGAEVKRLSDSREHAEGSLLAISSGHSHLRQAAENGQSDADIKLRSDAYMNRVLLLRDAPQAAELRAWTDPAKLGTLFHTAQATEMLVARLHQPGTRDALLRQLRADAPVVQDIVLEIGLVDRRIGGQSEGGDRRHGVQYLAALGIIMLTLLTLSLVAIRLTQRLRETGHALSSHLATQEAILRSVDEAIVVLCQKGCVFYSNPNAQRLLGRTAASGRHLSASKGLASILVGEIAEMIRGGEGPGPDGPRISKVKIPSPGRPRHYEIRVFPAVAGPHARPDCTVAVPTHVVVIRDVTTEEELSQRREEYDAGLVEASRLLALAAISGGIVHEISQPLAAIRNYVYSLKADLSSHPGTEEQSVIAKHLGEEIDRAIEVVRNVRRLAAQDMQDVGACDIQEAIEHSVRLVALGRTPPPSIAVHAPAHGTRVSGSLPMLGQVIVNLLTNAIAASAEAGRSGAEVSVRLADGYARITVDDFGNGVSPEAAQTLFSPFAKSTRGGMGLGLAICQRLAATLGGSLCWENRPGGASFTFSVPLAKDNR
jgi:C4-dicarboxylate-specific signal transduction histidine kinase